MKERINLTQFLTKETALYALIALYKYGVLRGNYEPALNRTSGFWELREV